MSAIKNILRVNGGHSGNNRAAFRVVILALLILLCMGMAYYFYFIEHKDDIVFSHFFYVPIVLSGLWWGRRAVWVCVFLGGCLIAAHVLSRLVIPSTSDIFRVVMFVVVGIVVGSLKERSLKIEETTKLAHAELDQIFNAAASAMLLIDKNFNLLRVNETFTALFGISKHEATGRKCYEVFPGPRCHTPDCPLKQILSGEERLEYDAQRERRDGVKIHCLFTGIPLRNSEGDLIGIIEDFKDFTEHNQLQEKLEAAKTYAENIIANFLDTLIVTNPDGTIRTINQATLDLLEYKEEELIGKPVGMIFAEEEEEEEEVKPFFTGSLEKLLRRGVMRNYELTYVTRSGRRIPMSFNASVMRDEKGKIVGLVAGAKDISNIKETEAQLRQAQKMEAVGILAGGIAHDFNNLLTTIIGNTELILMNLDKDDPMCNEIEEIKKAGSSAASLTRQLLAFSRKQILKPEILNLNILISNLEKMLRRIIGEDIELKTFMYPDLGNVEVDAGQIEQVIMNLAINSKDAMPRGGTLTIETANVELDETHFRDHGVENRPGHYVMFSISDSGIGMDEETLSHIFEPFFTTKEIGKGTGLGMSTVYGIIKQSNGHICVYSEPGKGTTFNVYIPRTDLEPVKKNELPEGLVKGTETILVAEDNGMLREFTLKILKRYGYTVLEAQDGEEALEISNKHEGSIHLLLTDVVMPRMGGWEMAKQLKSERPGIRVLYMSGYTDDAIVHHEVLAKDISFIQKPFSPEKLARKIRLVLEQNKRKPVVGHILVIDDDEQIRRMLRQVLERAGYEVMEAPNGKVGIKLYRQRPADLVITDLIMPQKEGIETIMELRSDFPDVKIIAMSGGGHIAPESYLRIAKGLGALHTLKKPIETKELLERVWELIG